MWDTKLKLIDTDSRMVVSRGKAVGGAVKDQGGQIYGDRRFYFGWLINVSIFNNNNKHIIQ